MALDRASVRHADAPGLERLARGFEEYYRLWERWAEALRASPASRLDAPAVSDRSPALARSDAFDVWRRWWSLQWEYGADLLALSLSAAQRAVDVLLPVPAPQATHNLRTAPDEPAPVEADVAVSALPARTARLPAIASPTPQPGRDVALALDGAIGETVARPFLVANRTTSAVEVGFEATEFVSIDGTARLRAPVMFLPERFVLGAGEERSVECSLEISPRFRPGVPYLAWIRVRGFEAMQMGLIVSARPRVAAQSIGERGAVARPREGQAARTATASRKRMARKKRASRRSRA
jgi:hypothetical protein